MLSLTIDQMTKFQKSCRKGETGLVTNFPPFNAHFQESRTAVQYALMYCAKEYEKDPMNFAACGNRVVEPFVEKTGTMTDWAKAFQKHFH